MFKRILVPLDGSRFSARALRYAVGVAECFGSEIILLRVVSPTSLTLAAAPPAGEESPIVTEIAVQEARRQDARNMARAVRYLRDKVRGIAAKGVKGSHHVVMGVPAKSIIDFCRKGSVGLVVMTGRGRGGLKRAFLGSITDEVIRQSGSHVLVVRSKKPRKK
ncbi:universal stress protein [Chloroflexota bacterium]